MTIIKVFFKIALPEHGDLSVNDQLKKANRQLPNFRLNVLFTSSILTYCKIFHTRKSPLFCHVSGIVWQHESARCMSNYSLLQGPGWDSISARDKNLLDALENDISEFPGKRARLSAIAEKLGDHGPRDPSCQGAYFISRITLTDGSSLSLVETTNVWSGRVTGYSIFLRMGHCLLATGIPNGMWLLSSLQIMVTLFFPTAKTAKSSTYFIVTANHRSLLSLRWLITVFSPLTLASLLWRSPSVVSLHGGISCA